MRNAFLATSFLILLVLAHAETFEKAKLRGLSKKMSTESIFLAMKDTQFGRNLLNMLTLKFQTTQNLGRLFDVLTELENEINGQQQAEDQEYTATSTHYQGIIEEQSAIIVDAQSQIDYLNGQLAERRDELRQANEARALLLQEREAIVNQIAEVTTARAQESAAFQNRVQNSQLLREGVQRTYDLFRSSVENQELDQEAVGNVLTLLENVGASIDASIADDTRAENEAESLFQNYLVNRHARVDEIDAAVTVLDGVIARLEAEIADLEANLQAQTVRKQNAEDLRTQTQAALDDLTARYNSNRAVRADQVRILTLIRGRLSTNSEEVQEVLNTRF